MRVSQESLARMATAFRAAHAEACVSEARYRARLAHCTDCDALQYGSTCVHCGCFVAVRAWLADQACPRPGNAAW